MARWAYSSSKAIDEILAYAYHRGTGLADHGGPLFTRLGRGQSAAYGMVVPRLVRQAVAGEALTVYGDGTQTRSFCHVSDVVEALSGLLEEPGAVGDVFNVGSTEEISIGELARRIVEQTHSASQIIHLPYEVAYEVGFEDMVRRVPDVTKIAKLTGWRATHTLTEILDDVIAEVRAEVSPSVAVVRD